ncbi:MAG: hypothetical protein FJY62_01600 [Betaproteobacteria bacterium]|nr:hypothetical protein [Betaproteobacteria bacterium]
MEPSTPPPLKADVAPRIYVLDGYLPSRQWPEIESAWQAVLQIANRSVAGAILRLHPERLPWNTGFAIN